MNGVEWFKLDELPEIGFDYGKLAKDALKQLRSNIEECLILGEILLEKFTITELQYLYESLLDEKFDRRNFREKALQTGCRINIREKKIGHRGGHDLYIFKNQ